MILSICSEPKVLEIMRIINIFITIIKIVVPILLIFILMFKFVKATINDDKDNLQHVLKTAPSNLIAAIVIFLIPTLVSLIVRISFPNSDYKNCLTVKTTEQIQAIYISKIDNYISNIEQFLNDEDINNAYNNYNNAVNYLSYIKDKDKKTAYEEKLAIFKEQIDELYKKLQDTRLVSTGLGRDIVPTEELITACSWVLNQELVNIRLRTCDGEHRYENADAQLPGGASERETYDVAKETIPLSEYAKGVFFGEESVATAPDSRYAFIIMYRTVFLHNTVHYAIGANRNPLLGEEITYKAGSCAQNYKMVKKRQIYDSGQYRGEIDDAQETTKYLILANTNGETTDARYHSYTGIEQAVVKAGKEGKDFIEILENVIKQGNDDSRYYKDAKIYDCRNLYESKDIEYLVE